MTHNSPAETRTFDLATGVALSCALHGDPEGKPVLLLHGITDSLRSFDLLLPHLPSTWRAIVPSQRGHGDSERPLIGYAMADFAADADALLTACGVERALVVGHSMGAAVGLRFALAHPDRVLGLLLLGGAASWRNPALLDLDGILDDLSDPLDPGFVKEFQESTVAAPVSPLFMETVVAESRKAPLRVWRAALDGLLAEDAAADLSHLRAPVVAVRGEEDGVVPVADHDALIAALPGGDGVVYPGVGHAPQWEAPDRVAAELAQLAGRLVPAAG